MVRVAGARLGSFRADLLFSIDQLDKADAPIIPDTYLYLLALQCLVTVSEGLASFTLPLYASIIRRRRPGKDFASQFSPALDLAELEAELVDGATSDAAKKESLQDLKTVYAMAENGWPALLAALSFLLSTNPQDELFADVIGAVQSIT